MVQVVLMFQRLKCYKWKPKSYFRHRWMCFNTLSKRRNVCWCYKRVHLQLRSWLWRRKLWNRWYFKWYSRCLFLTLDNYTNVLRIPYSTKERIESYFKANSFCRYKWMRFKPLSKWRNLRRRHQFIYLQLCSWLFRRQLWNR